MSARAFSDETLMAFADGELDAAEAAAVGAAIDGDPALAKRVDAFRMTRRSVRAAFGEIAREPVPAALTAFVMAGGASRASSATRPPLVRRLMPMAAALACLLAGGTGYWLGMRGAGPSPVAQVVALGPLAAALDTLDDGARQTVGTGAIALQQTLRTRAGICRTFRLDQSQNRFDGVACRGSGAWRVEVLAATRDGGTYAPASSAGPVESFLDGVEAGEPLPTDQVRRLRQGGWRAD